MYEFKFVRNKPARKIYENDYYTITVTDARAFFGDKNAIPPYMFQIKEKKPIIPRITFTYMEPYVENMILHYKHSSDLVETIPNRIEMLTIAYECCKQILAQIDEMTTF